jgi:predicted kinase
MIIIIFGLPATGKTYLSEHLADELNAVHLNTDIIRKKLGKEGEYDRSTKQEVYDSLLEEAIKNATRHRYVIIDGTFWKGSLRKKFMKMARNVNREILFIEMKADENAIKERMKMDRGRSEADFDVYRKIRKQFEPMSEPHLVMRSDELKLNEMLNRAKQFIDEKGRD